MSFSAISRHVPLDDAGWGQWHLAHAREHREFTSTLLGQTPPVETAEYPIETMGDAEAWLTAHMEMSQSVWSGIGGGQSTDLRTVDWSDKDQVEQWMQTHAAWHQQVRDSLGL